MRYSNLLAPTTKKELLEKIKKKEPLYKVIFNKDEYIEGDLSNQILIECDFEETNFFRANLSNSQFYDCNFRKANLSCVNFTKSKLIGCSLFLSNLFDCNLQDTIFYETDLRRANLSLFKNKDLVTFSAYGGDEIYYCDGCITVEGRETISVTKYIEILNEWEKDNFVNMYNFNKKHKDAYEYFAKLFVKEKTK